MHVICVRHGEATHNLRRVCSDDPADLIPLTARGRQQALEAAQMLRNHTFDAIFSSPFPRTLETARIINTHHGIAITIDSRLSDWATGGFNGKSSSLFHLHRVDDDWKLQGGESLNDIRIRIDEFLHDLQRTSHMSVLIVTHHVPIQIVQERMLGAATKVRCGEVVPCTM